MVQVVLRETRQVLQLLKHPQGDQCGHKSLRKVQTLIGLVSLAILALHLETDWDETQLSESALLRCRVIFESIQQHNNLKVLWTENQNAFSFLFSNYNHTLFVYLGPWDAFHEGDDFFIDFLL